jgi:transposase-like protein
MNAKEQDNLVYITLHAKEIFKELRWKEGVVCPYCGEKHIYHFKNGTYKCSHCRKHFTDTSNTIFHATKIPISHWLIALYLVTMGKGVSSEELSKFLGITQKTSWYLLHKIRFALKTENIALSGNIAVDEVYLGGKWSSIIVPKKIDILQKYGLWFEGDVKHTWHKKNIQRAISEYKQPVYGMNDGNNIVLTAVPNHFTSKDLLNLTLKHCNNIDRLMSDQSSLYKDISAAGIEVVQMNHSKGEFKKDGWSSNRIEGTFSHLKRRYRLQYVRPGKKYIQLYLNEFCFRWNNRNNTAMLRLEKALQSCCNSGIVTRKTIDSYDWCKPFGERKRKRIERLEDCISAFRCCAVQRVIVDGVEYTKKDFERLVGE